MTTIPNIYTIYKQNPVRIMHHEDEIWVSLNEIISINNNEKNKSVFARISELFKKSFTSSSDDVVIHHTQREYEYDNMLESLRRRPTVELYNTMINDIPFSITKT